MNASRPLNMARMLLIFLMVSMQGHTQENLLSVRTLALKGGDMPKWYVGVEANKLVELPWSSKQPSVSIVARAGRELPIYSQEPNDKGELEFKIVKKVPIPGGASEVLLLGWSEPEIEKVGLIAIEDNFKKAAFNDWMLINITKQPVAFRCGRQSRPIKVSAGKTETYRIKAENDKGAELIAQAMIDGEMKTVFSTYWPVFGGQRAIVIFYNVGERIRVRRIVDPFEVRETSEP